MSEKDLFSDFSPSSFDEWRQKIEKDLKGKEYETLQSHTPENITIEPAYHRQSVQVKDQPFKAMAKWDICQEILVEDAKAANKLALDHLQRGATSLLFYLNGDTDLETLLKDVKLEYLRTNFVVEGDVEKLIKNFKDLIHNRGLKEIEIAGSVNIDCLENLARTGNWFKSEEEDFARIKNNYEQLPKHMQALCVNANLFANAGASLAQQLGIALAMVYEYIHRLELKSGQSFWTNFSIGSDYFGEIAKLRAYRRLWAQLSAELRLEETETFIYSETSLRNKTIKDRYNNMVRTTSESMAGIIGGANEFSVKGFNHTFKESDFFGERLAKNQQLILEHESHFKEVSDMARGSYFIEELTEKLAKKGWEFFKQIEAEGGFVESLKKGWLQARIEKAAEQEQKAFDEKQKVLIGANKYIQQDENLEEIIKQGMFASPGNATEIKRVLPRRLAEGLEKG